MFLAVLYYPAKEYSLVLLQINAKSEVRARSMVYEYVESEEWDRPTDIKIYGLNEGQGVNHLETLRRFSKE